MGVDWIKLAHNMVRWQKVEQTVQKLRDVQGPHYIRQITVVTSPHNCTVVAVGYVNTMSGPTGSDERYSSEKMAGDFVVQLRDRVCRRGCGRM